MKAYIAKNLATQALGDYKYKEPNWGMIRVHTQT